MREETAVLLRLDSINFSSLADIWWSDLDHLRLILECVRQVDLWPEKGHYGKSGSSRLRRLGTLNELLRNSTSWKRGLYTIQSEQAGMPPYRLGFSLEPGAFELRLRVSGNELETRRPTIIDQLIELTTLLYARFKNVALFGPNLGVEIYDLPYPRPRPPRETGFWSPGNAVDFMSQRFLRQRDHEDAAAIAKLLIAPMPHGARRIKKDDLVIFRWVDDLVDDATVARQRSLHEQWFAHVLEPPIDPNFNEAGDQRETPLQMEKKPPLTFYDAFSETGYKAVVVNLDGSIDEESVSDLRGWVETKALPDDTPLQRLVLIVPSREAAIRVHERAIAIGASGVYYPDDEGAMWNPFPPGLWLNQGPE